MFKKRSVKGQKRAIRRDSESGSDVDGDSEIVIKKQRRIQELDGEQIRDNDKSEIDTTLSRNDEATKVDRLHQEILDKHNALKVEKATDSSNEQVKYATFIKAKATGMDQKGPKKTAANVRSTTTFDFQRDVCKDYKQTGFCGYGDSCKFLHARDDFKAGWKLNQEWNLESNQKKQKEREKDLKGIPFKCVICKGNYKDPIKTSCDHYFCELCFLTRNKKSSKCAICGKNTDGTAQPAKNLNEILKLAALDM